MSGSIRPGLPTCDACKRQIRGEYVSLYAIHVVLCPECFNDRRIHRADPAAVGRAIADDAIQGALVEDMARRISR